MENFNNSEFGRKFKKAFNTAVIFRFLITNGQQTALEPAVEAIHRIEYGINTFAVIHFQIDKGVKEMLRHGVNCNITDLTIDGGGIFSERI